jgi:hypothetical protein
MYLPNREKTPKNKVAKEPRPDIQTLLAATSHILVEGNSDRVGCARCHNSFRSNDPSLKHWLTCPCSELRSSADRPVPIPYEELHIGNTASHFTHSLNQYRGLIYCRKCGSRGGANQLRKLSKPCAPPTTYGRQTLSALSEGRLPPKLKQWPS